MSLRRDKLEGMRIWLEQLTHSLGVRQSLLTVAGNLAASGLSAVALILITRFLGPEKFGLFSVAFSLSLILNRLNDAGLNTAILKFAPDSKKGERAQIFAATLRYKLMFSVLILAGGWVFSLPLAHLLHISEPSLLLAAFALSLVTTYYEHLISVLQSLHAFGQAVVAAVMASGFKVLVALFFWLGMASHPVAPVYVWYMAGPAVPLLLWRWLMPQGFSLRVSRPSMAWRTKITHLSKHASVALISAGIIENVDVLFVQRHLNSYETGLYGGVSRIALLFAVIAYSLGNVLYPRVARYKTREHLTSYLKKAWGVAGLALLGFLAFLPMAHFILIWTIGPEYLAGLPILWLLTGASFLAIAAVPFIALFYSLDADWYFSVSGVVQLFIVLVGNAVFVPAYGLEAAAWTRLAVRAFLLIFSAGLGIMLVRRQYAKA